MTEATNPLLGRRSSAAAPSTIMVNGHPVPTDIRDYCAWLNDREKRRGRWAVVEKDGKRTVDFHSEIATADFLRERGMIPKIAKRAA